jgi:uncharacterized protein involved in outer membrane biogenesis
VPIAGGQRDESLLIARTRFDLSRKRVLLLVAGLLGAVVLAGLGGVAVLATIDLRPLIQSFAFRALDRQLTIGTLRIGWGNPLSVELTDVHLANASWGSEPEMFRSDSVAAEIDLRAILRGVWRYDKLRLGKSQLLLERGAGNVANWRFPKSGSSWLGRPVTIIPKDRTQFPTLLDFALHDGTLVLRVPGSRDIRLDFHDATIRAPGEDQAVSLSVDGAYNGLPVRLAGETASFSVMRDGAAPFGSHWTLSAAAGTLGFQGTMTEPLDFDGVDGKVQIDSPKLGELLKIVGSDLRWDVPLHLAATAARRDTHWQLAESEGTIAKSRFGGTLVLNEAGRHQPDAVTLDLAFAKLDLKALFPGEPASAGMSLQLDENPGVTIDARIAAQHLTFGTMEVADFAIHGTSAPGAISVGALSFAVAGGRVEGSGSAHAVKAGTSIAANIGLSGGDAGEIARLAGAAAGQIAGKVDARATVEMTAQTLTEVLARSSGYAAVAMRDGQIARDFIEKASTDLRVLFRTGEGWVAASCLLGVVNLRDGIATIAQLRLRTPDTTLVGSGMADLKTDRLDMTIHADSAGSSVFALNVPLHVAGKFVALSVLPTIGPPAAAPRDTPAGTRLPPDLEALVASNPCRNG